MQKVPVAPVTTAQAAIKCIAFLLPAVLGAALAHADSAQRVPVLQQYQQECAACHMAYPPGMLPGASWKRVMGSLDKHYGVDASLDAAGVHEISGWLQTYASTRKRASEEPPQDRITRSQWFVRKHREVDPHVWKQPAVKSAANCTACHTAGDKGSFRESEIQFPKGLDARFLRSWSD